MPPRAASAALRRAEAMMLRSYYAAE